MGLPTWSYSGMKSFNDCPRKFYHLKVIRDFSEPLTTATMYGTEFHTAAELYIKDGTPLPAHFAYAKNALDKLDAIPGDKLCEYEMGLTENLEPCGFKDERMWWRGIADLLIINYDTKVAHVLDYKTGKSAKYADKGQLELMALAVFKHFPMITNVKAGLLFVVSKDFVKDQYPIESEAALWEKWLQQYNRMRDAYTSNVWNPRPSGLCKKHCVVLSCPHNGRN